LNAVDTNVLVRIIVQDDPAQSERAAAFCRQGVLVSLTVAMETEWVLRSRYKMDRETILKHFNLMVEGQDLYFENLAGFAWVLERYAEGADFADMIHLLASLGTEGFGSFDQSLVAEAGDATPVPIVLV
jgi:predicted nucleic-acid-binding protein